MRSRVRRPRCAALSASVAVSRRARWERLRSRISGIAAAAPGDRKLA
jgi:hypothetical protein